MIAGMLLSVVGSLGVPEYRKDAYLWLKGGLMIYGERGEEGIMTHTPQLRYRLGRKLPPAI